MKKCKWMALLMTSVLVIGMLSACGGNTSGNNTGTTNNAGSTSATAGTAQTSDEGSAATAPVKENVGGLELPLTDEKKELEVFMDWSSTVLENPNESKGTQMMEERTNVHINWQTYSQSEMIEKFNIVLTTGEYPDIMFPAGTNSYPGGYLQGIEDGVLVDMDQYMQYMPNYMAKLNSSPDALAQAAYDDGKFHGVRVIRGTNSEVKGPGAVFGPTYRSDLLEKMGEELPRTIQGWHDLLVKCRDNGMSAPMTLESDGGTALSLAWGINTDWSSSYWQYDYETDTVQYAPLLDGFDEWLQTMAQWYQEGLIDKNFTAGSAIITKDYSNIETDQTMLFDIWFGFMNGSFLYDSGFVTNPNCYLQAFDGVVLNEGDEVIKCVGDACIAQEIFVTTKTEDPVLAAKWLDYQYSTEGIQYRYYGIEGESYTIDSNGVYQYTDAIINDPKGLTPSEALASYALGSYMGYQNDEAGDILTIQSSADGRSATVESVALWASPEKTIHMPNGPSLNLEEQEITSTYMTDITTVVQEHMVKTIIGEDHTSHADFVAKLKQYHIDDCIKCWQDACDRFNNR